MVKFLLDAKLSPRVARFLSNQISLDVISLQGQRLGDLPDHEVIALARRQRRVIITLDGDYSDYVLDAPRREIGVIHLDLPSRLRNIPSIIEFLKDLLTSHATTIDLDHALVIIHEEELVIHRL